MWLEKPIGRSDAINEPRETAGAGVAKQLLQFVQQFDRRLDHDFSTSGLNHRIDGFVAAFRECLCRGNIRGLIVGEFHDNGLREGRTAFDRHPQFYENFAG